ncbi:MBL fold metallo-hydrolase [Azospirillum brasilense]|uniref:MBL fold metallo-hydrolase n=1 Tax=Azospirillum brasilense TaxID=192 RepID=A0A235HBM8_AZOBR|nr:MBL fold metallo-hydrolase [Azospirillum brasilense]OYD82917.1 MBL fold metallo-hydrolase [Azospirillum brasilense]
MVCVSRRSALGALAASPVAAALLPHLTPTAAQAQQTAQPSPNVQQAPGFYRVRVGDLIVTRINDGQFARPNPTEGFVRNASPDDVAAALRDAFLPTEALTIPITFMAVQGGGRTVLIDTGTGGQLMPTAAFGARNMAAAGIDPARVTMVVISHFHPDHISGLAGADGKPLFPNAEILVPEAEWAFWMDDAAMSRAPEAMQGTFKTARARFGAYPQERIRRYDANAEVAPGIQAIAAAGHTPGHTAFAVSSGGKQLMVLSDTSNHPALFVRNPGWHAVFDMDPALAEANRRKLFDRAAADRMPVVGYHFPFPGVGHISQRDRGFEFEPAPWSAEI